MRRRTLAVLSTGVVVAAVTGAGTAAAPGARGPPPPQIRECRNDSGVTVAWILDDDITAVRAVEVGNLPESCRRQMIRVTLRDVDGALLARATKRPNAAATSVAVDLDDAVAAAAITLVELVIGGNIKG